MASSASSATSSPAPTFTPAVKPPPGQVSDPANPGSQIDLCDLTVGVCLPIVTIVFLCRAYVRLFIKRTWIIEDWLVLAAWAGVVTYGALVLKLFRSHLGEHIWSITADDLHEALYWFNIAAISYGPFICFAKVAILLLYRRIFCTRRWTPFDLTIVTLIALMVAFYTITDFLKIFQCTPRVKIYIPSTPGTCINSASVLNASGLFNTITDFVIYCLPLYSVWNLKMSKRKKWAVFSVFTFGLLAPVFSLAGFIVRWKVASDIDSTWEQPQISFFSLAELTTATICACFAEITPLFRRKGRDRYRRYGGARYDQDTATLVNSKRRNGLTSGNAVESSPYIELGEPKKNTANTTTTPRPDTSQVKDGEIRVDREVRVFSG